jgi:hypothetical protein
MPINEAQGSVRSVILDGWIDGKENVEGCQSVKAAVW